MHDVQTFEAAAAATAARGGIVLCITTDDTLSDFTIIDISDGPPLREAWGGMKQEGKHFVGLLMLSDGAPSTLLNMDLPADTLQTLATACVAHINRKFEAAMRSVGMPAAGLETMKECA